MSLNRGLPSTSQMDGLTKLVERIEKSQEIMHRHMGEINEFFEVGRAEDG